MERVRDAAGAIIQAEPAITHNNKAYSNNDFFMNRVYGTTRAKLVYYDGQASFVVFFGKKIYTIQ
jgi:hypothetical protein